MSTTTHLNFFRNATAVQQVAAGETIFRAGDEPDTMYGVQAGEVEIVLDGRVIDVVGSGEFFGEMALIDNAPRSADAVAKTDCVLVPIDRNRFIFMVQEHPTFPLVVLQVMAERLRRRMNVA